VGIQQGIMLHRAIDTFTDSHPATQSAKEVFRPHYRLYCGAFVDVVYDHFLASDKNEFDEPALLQFSEHVYSIVQEYSQWFPERFAKMFPYMKTQNWLFNYRTRWGAEKSFGGLVRRSAYLTESDTASLLFEEHYQRLEECYRLFWKEVKPFVQNQFALFPDPGNNNT
jgi:acyl carrier protein phosphodiesterase